MLNRVFIFIFLVSGLQNLAYSEDYIDSLETRLILVDNDQKLLILDEIIPYYFRNEPLQASNKAEKMLGLAKQQNNQEYQIKAQRYIGLSKSYLTSNHEDALLKCYEAENNAKSNGFIEELILTKLTISDIYHQIGDNTKSLDYQIVAYELADSMNYTHLSSIILNSQARSFIELEDFDKAEICLKKALKSAKMMDQKEIEATSDIMFGDLYSARFNYQLALEHYKQAHEIYVHLGKDIHVAIALFKLGDTFFALDQLDTSFQYHLNALAIRNRIKDHTGLGESYNQIGMLCIENEEYQRAINNLKLGLSNAEMVNSNLLMQQSFDYLYHAYLGNDDFENAVFYQNKYSNITDLIYAEASEKKIEEISNRKTIELREQEIASLQEIRDRKEEQLATSRKFNFTLILLLIVVAFSATFFIRSYREKKRMNEKLTRINKQVTEQNEKLTELNSTKDKFFSIIGHDLRGPLNSLTSFSQLLINHTASLSEEEIRTIARDLDKSLKNLYELLDNLLGWARSQTGRIDFKPEGFKISAVLKENIRLLSKAALNKKINIELMADENIEVFADINSVKTVIRNLLSNAIKFTHPEGIITLYVDELKDRVEIGIHDTGVGMSKETQESIFDISAKHSSLGTNREKGTGLGLILCKEFVETNHGIISVESSVGEGSTFKFTLPKNQKFEEEHLDHVQV